MNGSEKTTPMEQPENITVSETAVADAEDGASERPESIISKAHSAQYIIDKLLYTGGYNPNTYNIYSAASSTYDDRIKKYTYVYFIFVSLFITALFGFFFVKSLLLMLPNNVNAGGIVGCVCTGLFVLVGFVAAIILSVVAISTSYHLKRDFDSWVLRAKVALDCEEEVATEELTDKNFSKKLTDAKIAVNNNYYDYEEFPKGLALSIIIIVILAFCTTLLILQLFVEYTNFWSVQWYLLYAFEVLCIGATIFAHVAYGGVVLELFADSACERKADKAVKKIIAEETEKRNKVIKEYNLY